MTTMSPAALPVHFPLVQIPDAQATPHPPQFCGSPFESTQLPPHAINGEGHADAHA
ncbi:MAG TPA: hypothetical protein VN770_08070 [Gaiellaceae bacterium]|nr:hypothetical protein [Gaiellaceae bacterium]